jgi:hypothetical protein
MTERGWVMSEERISTAASAFLPPGRKAEDEERPGEESPRGAVSRDATRGSGPRTAGNRPRRLELESFIDLAHCRRCGDKGIYCRDELVGAVTRTENRWQVWRILDFGRPLDRAELAMYEERMSRIAAFDSLHDARRYIKGPFCEMVLRELESKEKKEK